MERIALIAGGYFIAWSSIILILAGLAAGCIFLALYLSRGGSALSAGLVLPLSVVLGILLSRFVHWYCRTESYESLFRAMTDLSSGGFALIGMFAGAFLAALLTRLLGTHRDLPGMLDCMALAGGAGISAGRLACFFNSADRGQIVRSLQTLPWVYPVTNAVSGAAEYRLATFLLQSMAVGILTAGLTVYFLSRHPRRGDTALLFLLCYCAGQVVLDSTRYDAIYFHSNGFVSIVQVFSAIAIVTVAVIFSLRAIRCRGLHPGWILLWVAMLGFLGGAGYMEYHVQRHGNEALFAYSVMSVCLMLFAVLTLAMRSLGKQYAVRGRYSRK